MELSYIVAMGVRYCWVVATFGTATAASLFAFHGTCVCVCVCSLRHV